MSDGNAKPRVLLVDDESAVWQILGEKLGRSGYEWCGRSSAEDALACLEQERFDAIVSDLKMPAMTGLQLLAE
ncbi:MAG TPA: response regulator, partial [Candidatus Angelobacter sp.]|nr:response regulator [Candidatus Angelobacter sp.]